MKLAVKSVLRRAPGAGFYFRLPIQGVIRLYCCKSNAEKPVKGLGEEDAATIDRMFVSGVAIGPPLSPSIGVIT